MRDESNWLIGVVENLLSVTRMSGASNIKKELEAGEEVLSAAAMKFQRHYPATRVEISAPDTLLMIPMDIILIEQVLINLMENAVQHGKTTTQISLRLTRSDDLAVFEVSDDGQGIAPPCSRTCSTATSPATRRPSPTSAATWASACPSANRSSRPTAAPCAPATAPPAAHFCNSHYHWRKRAMKIKEKYS